MLNFSKQDRIYTLIGILLALFLGALDQTIVATALPKIVEDLHGLSRFAWVATAYIVASTAFVPIYGKLADMYNKKHIEIIAVSIFLLGSFLCGLSGEFGTLPIFGDGMNQLIIFRAIQGIGGAGLFGMAFIIIADLYPPSERGKYQGFVGAVFGIASVLGPWSGGLLTDYGSAIISGIEGWRWVFYVNLPFGILAFWFIITRMPHLPPKTHRQPINLIHAALLIAGLSALILGLQTDKMEHPWLSPFTLSFLGFAAACIGLFSLRSIRSANPILDFSLFRNKVFAISNLSLFFFGAAFFSIIVFLPLFMINVVGVSATKAGISLIPLSLGLVAGSVTSGQLVSRFGRYKLWMLSGGIVLLGGVILLSLMNYDIPYWQVTVYMLICGLGIGPSMPLFTLAIQNAVPITKMGQATSASQFFRQIGGAVGAAVMGTVLTTTLMTHFAGLPQTAGQRAGFNTEAMSATGGADISKEIHKVFDKEYNLIKTVAVNQDPKLKMQLINDPYLPQQLKNEISNGSLDVSALPRIKMMLDEKADEIVYKIKYSIKQAFTNAITKIYFYTIFIVIMAILSTIFIPELKLKDRHEMAGPHIDV